MRSKSTFSCRFPVCSLDTEYTALDGMNTNFALVKNHVLSIVCIEPVDCAELDDFYGGFFPHWDHTAPCVAVAPHFIICYAFVWQLLDIVQWLAIRAVMITRHRTSIPAFSAMWICATTMFVEPCTIFAPHDLYGIHAGTLSEKINDRVSLFCVQNVFS